MATSLQAKDYRVRLASPHPGHPIQRPPKLTRWYTHSRPRPSRSQRLNSQHGGKLRRLVEARVEDAVQRRAEGCMLSLCLSFCRSFLHRPRDRLSHVSGREAAQECSFDLHLPSSAANDEDQHGAILLDPVLRSRIFLSRLTLAVVLAYASH